MNTGSGVLATMLAWQSGPDYILGPYEAALGVNNLRREFAGNAENQTMELIVEIRAAEGGHDAKLLVQKQYTIYCRLGARRCL